MELQSLNSIFTERIFRIPDYQRGYAWTIPQLEDYWEDLMQLDSEHIHYTGVLTLEPVSKDICSKWEDEKWLINDLGYKPFYIVDGQQRLTTSMILIQAITESVDKNAFIASQAPSKIIDKFIMLKADDKLREGYIFGYEKDNPSDDFLKTEIFGMYSSKAQKKETLYTRNLKNAKDYFKEKLSGIEEDYMKYFKLFEDFLDIPDNEIYTILMSKKENYEGIFLYKGKEVKPATVQAKIKEFIKYRDELSLERIKQSYNWYMQDIGELSEKNYTKKDACLERIDFLEKQPKDMLLIFQFEDGWKNTATYGNPYTTCFNITLLRFENVKEVIERDTYIQIGAHKKRSGWLPKEYYFFQYNRLHSST